MSRKAAYLELRAEDLLDARGFSGGEAASSALRDWAGAAWPGRAMAVGEEDPESPLWTYLDARALLCELVTTHLLPVLPRGAEAHLRSGYYFLNPIRIARSSDAELLELRRSLEKLDAVRVDAHDAARACERIFPERTREWLLLYAQLRWVDQSGGMLGRSPLFGDLKGRRDRHAEITDRYAHGLRPGEIALLSELIRSRATPQMPEEELDGLKRAAQACFAL